jgi:AcrR family transcriptional regulator
MSRKYEQTQRARSRAETHQRIVEATVALHNELGPARTTISAIAERAGVQRLTVYRHFPDERSLYQACGGHWNVEHPRPDPGPWAVVEDPAERLQLALSEIYAYFRATENMTANVRRDLPELPVLQEVAAPTVRYWEEARALLERGWEARGQRRERLSAVIGHAIDFDTWRSLARQGNLTDAEVAELMARRARAV